MGIIKNILIEKVDTSSKNSFSYTSWETDSQKLTIGDVLDYLDKIGCKTVNFPIDKIWDLCCHKGKENYENSNRVQNAKLEYPIIMVEKNGEYIILDGHHRLMKAKSLDHKTINARVFNIEKSPELFKKLFKF